MFRQIRLVKNNFKSQKLKITLSTPQKTKIKEGVFWWINVENKQCLDTLDWQEVTLKNSKTQKWPHKTPKNEKSKKECSSELM